MASSSFDEKEFVYYFMDKYFFSEYNGDCKYMCLIINIIMKLRNIECSF